MLGEKGLAHPGSSLLGTGRAPVTGSLGEKCLGLEKERVFLFQNMILLLHKRNAHTADVFAQKDISASESLAGPRWASSQILEK